MWTDHEVVRWTNSLKLPGCSFGCTYNVDEQRYEIVCTVKDHGKMSACFITQKNMLDDRFMELLTEHYIPRLSKSIAKLREVQTV